jgi:hypothetical protein
LEFTLFCGWTDGTGTNRQRLSDIGSARVADSCGPVTAQTAGSKSSVQAMVIAISRPTFRAVIASNLLTLPLVDKANEAIAAVQYMKSELSTPGCETRHCAVPLQQVV